MWLAKFMKTGILYYIHPSLCSFWSSFLPDAPRFFLTPFLSIWRRNLSKYVTVGLWVTESLSFLHLRIFLFLFHSWSSISLDTQITSDCFFYCFLKSALTLPSGLNDFKWEVYCPSNSYSPIESVQVFSGCFQEFMMCLTLDIFQFILFEVLPVFQMCRFVSFENLKSFSSLSLWILFQLYFLLSFWNSKYINVGSSVIDV